MSQNYLSICFAPKGSSTWRRVDVDDSTWPDIWMLSVIQRREMHEHGLVKHDSNKLRSQRCSFFVLVRRSRSGLIVAINQHGHRVSFAPRRVESSWCFMHQIWCCSFEYRPKFISAKGMSSIAVLSLLHIVSMAVFRFLVCLFILICQRLLDLIYHDLLI